jgi:HAD superfamily hydrolase (TIGR01509 family)
MLNCAFNQESNKKIKAAIFDLDGTLLDTQRLYDEANQIVINQYGNGKPYDEELQIKIHGAPPSFGNKYLIEYFGIKLTMDEFMSKKDAYLKDRIPQCKPMEGVKELTHLLKHKYGLKLAIATSAFRNSTDIKLTNHKDWIKEDFDIIITGEDKRIKKGKPSPDIFLVAANDLGVKPGEYIIFEDAINGVQAGLSTGAAMVVGLPDDYAKNIMKDLPHDETRTKLYILKSYKDFDYSLLE